MRNSGKGRLPGFTTTAWLLSLARSSSAASSCASEHQLERRLMLERPSHTRRKFSNASGSTPAPGPLTRSTVEIGRGACDPRTRASELGNAHSPISVSARPKRKDRAMLVLRVCQKHMVDLVTASPRSHAAAKALSRGRLCGSRVAPVGGKRQASGMPRGRS